MPPITIRSLPLSIIECLASSFGSGGPEYEVQKVIKQGNDKVTNSFDFLYRT